MLHSDLIPELGCDGELIQIDGRYNEVRHRRPSLDLRNGFHL